MILFSFLAFFFLGRQTDVTERSRNNCKFLNLPIEERENGHQLNQIIEREL